MVLFIYQFTWGFVLYRFINSIVTPLMHRYPGNALAPDAVQLFLAEAQFRLMKTDLSHAYLWLLFGLLIIRMLVTPLMDAGVFYSLHHTHLNSGYRFFRGIKQLGGAFFLYYILRIVLTLAPLYWIIPMARKSIAGYVAYDDLLLKLLPYAGACLVYGYLINLCFTFVQMAKTTEHHPFKSLWIIIRHALVILSLTALILLITGAVTIIAMAASLIWAGLIALIGYQLYRLIHVFCRLWLLTSQYQVWMSKTDSHSV